MLLKYLFYFVAFLTIVKIHLVKGQLDENQINDIRNQNQLNQLTEHDIFTRLIQNLKNSQFLSTLSTTTTSTASPTTLTPTISSSTPSPNILQPLSLNSLYSNNPQIPSLNSIPQSQNDLTNYIDDNLRSNRLNIPIVAVLQPILIPYPVIMNSQQFPTTNNLITDEYDDAMSRGNLRRTPNANSPIYYVGLPPTSYSFLPNLNLNNLIGRNYPTRTTATIIPIHSLSTPTQSNFQSTLSSILNIPVNFLANGKPSNYIESPTNYNLRPGSDSKITNLKRQYLFNGRPDDFFVLPARQTNHFDSLYSNLGSEYL